MELTKEQRDAVVTMNGNICCMASAGSGKTSAFTTRIAYMIKNGIKPSEILAVSFTKKASEEIQKRVGKLVGKSQAEEITIGTFHSIAYRLMKQYDSDFQKYSILPDWNRFSWFNDMCKPSSYKNPNGLNLGLKAGELASFISYQKNNMVKPTDSVIIDDNVEYVKVVPRSMLQDAYITYERLKEKSRQIDFDDMLFKLYFKLLNEPEFAQKISARFPYVMIDEFQDTSHIVLEIIKMINTANVFVVGDFRQSIYKFINARVENILNFKHEFNDVKVIELNKNFRSSQNIVDFSNNIISNSSIKSYKDYKPSTSVSEVGEDVKLTLYADEHRQVSCIADEIERLKEQENIPLKEMSIMVRTNAQTALIEEIFADRDIPYDVSRTSSFFDRKEILDILSYARLAVDHSDDASFRRIYNTPNRFLSKKMLNELDEFASHNDINLFQAVQVAPCCQGKQSTISNIVELINDLTRMSEDNVNVGKILRKVVNSTRYMDFLATITNNPTTLTEREEAIEKLCEMGAKFPNMKAFLAHIATIKDKQTKAKGKDAVQVTTIHSAKGLEWDVSFVINCNNGDIPNDMNTDEEEERRLFYVACSRPRHKLYISWICFDNEMKPIEESCFIREMIGEYTANDMRKGIFRGKPYVTYSYGKKA